MQLRKRKNVPSSWQPPERGSLVFNVDYSKSENSLEAAVAGVIRDYKAVLVDGLASSILAESTEALALLTSLCFVEERSKREEFRGVQLQVQSDCTLLVGYIVEEEQSPWALRAWINECRAKLAQLKFVNLARCPRDANKLAN
ncbi:hypothetical protein NL676_036231 [Syzygium grande]|nr:hypothetical protein NL676_036231 [Syzygium grande]